MVDLQPHLSGALLTLRPVEASDFDGLFAVGSDPAVWAGHPNKDRYLEANFRTYFEDGLASRAALIALDRTSGAVAGWSRYSQEFAEAGEIEIGWTFLGRAYWGGAFNGEMKRLMLAHAFRFFDRVIFRIDEANLRSRRAAEKIGAEATPRTQITTVGGAPSRNLFYALSRPVDPP